MKNNYTVFSKWLAIKLIKRGFNCTNVLPNQSEEGLVVFYFEDTKQLHKVVDILVNANKEKY